MKPLLSLVLCTSLQGVLAFSGIAATNTVVPGQNVSGSIASVGRNEYYCFTAASNDIIFIALHQTGGPGEPRLELYDPSNTLVVTDNVVPIFLDNRRITNSGIWCLRVSENNTNETFTYVLSVNKLDCAANLRDAPDAGPSLLPGPFSVGTVGAAVDMDFYCFSAASNDLVSIALRRTSGTGEAVLQLFDPDGVRLVSQGENGHDTVFVDRRNLTKAGVYTVLVRESNINETYGYSLSYIVLHGNNAREACDGPEMITPGAFTSGCVSPANDMDIYRFNATSNDLVNIALRVSSANPEPLLQLYDPYCVLVTNATDNGYDTAFIGLRRLTKTGLYTLLVRENELNETFNYTLSYVVLHGDNAREACDGPEMITPGAFTSGCVSPANDMDIYRFNATSNDLVNIALRVSNADAEPLLQLYDPDCVLVTNATDNGHGTPFIDNQRLTKTGLYTLLVRENELNDTFNYTLSYVVLHGANAREACDGPEVINSGPLITGCINQPPDMDLYRFTAASNDFFNISLRRTSGLGEPRLQVYDPDCILVVNVNTDADLALLEHVRLAKTGLYTIHVRENNLNESYGYALSFIRIPGPNEPDPGESPALLGLNESRQASIPLGDMDAFAFAGIAGDTVRLNVRKVSGAGEPRVRLYGQDGAILANSASASSVSLSQCLTNTGTFTVFVRENNVNEGLSYRLTFSQTPGPPPINAPPEFLQAMTCSNMVLVRWSTNATGFRPQWAEQLTEPPSSIVWSDFPPPGGGFEGFYFITNSIPPRAKFFRLIKP